jgi:uncharacterized protein
VTRLFAAYVAPARARAETWRTALGFLLIVVAYLGITGALGWAMLASGMLQPDAGAGSAGSDPRPMLILLFGFGGGWLGLWLVLRLLHDRSLRSVMGHPPRVLADFVLGAVVLFGVGGGLTVLALPWLPPLESALPPLAWLMLLPLALVAVAIQTGAEEVVFRGYLQQQLAARFASPLVWMLLPSVLFGLAHLAPESFGAATWLVVAATGLFGLIAADLTARTGSVGLAWGMHFANNVLAILVVSAAPGMDALALLRLSEDAIALLVPLILFDMALLVAVWAACRFVLSRL